MSFDYDGGRRATSILASTFVLGLGALICAFIAIAFGQDVQKPVIIGGSLLLLMAIILWLLREKPQNKSAEKNAVWGTQQKAKDYLDAYRPRTKKRSATQYGTNEPPTVEELRELKDDANTWVPHGLPPKR